MSSLATDKSESEPLKALYDKNEIDINVFNKKGIARNEHFLS